MAATRRWHAKATEIMSHGGRVSHVPFITPVVPLAAPLVCWRPLDSCSSLMRESHLPHRCVSKRDALLCKAWKPQQERDARSPSQDTKRGKRNDWRKKTTSTTKPHKRDVNASRGRSPSRTRQRLAPRRNSRTTKTGRRRSVASLELEPKHVKEYKAAGVICYDFAPSGEMMILMCQLYGGRQGSKKSRNTHTAWTFPGGKRVEDDLSPAATAARELEEETGALLLARRTEPLLRDAVWLPQAGYALYLLRLRNMHDLPLRFAHAQGQVPAPTANRMTRDLMWVGLRELLSSADAPAHLWRWATHQAQDNPRGTSPSQPPLWTAHRLVRLLCRSGSLASAMRLRLEELCPPGTLSDPRTPSPHHRNAAALHGIAPSPSLFDDPTCDGDDLSESSVTHEAARDAPSGTSLEERRASGAASGSRRDMGGHWETRSMRAEPEPVRAERLVARLRLKALASTGMGGYTVATHSKYSCEVCRIRFSRAEDTVRHLRSRAHRRIVQRLLVQELLNRMALEDAVNESADLMHCVGEAQEEDWGLADAAADEELPFAGAAGERGEGWRGGSAWGRGEEWEGAGDERVREGGGEDGEALGLFPIPTAHLSEDEVTHSRHLWRRYSAPSLSQLRSPFVDPFSAHLRSHPKYTCDVCGIVFSRASDTVEHLQSDSHRRRVQMLLLEELERTSHSEPSHEEGDVWGAVSHGADRSPHSPSREASARHDPLLAIVLSKRREVDFIGMDGFLRPSYTVAGDESSAQ